jgi:alpha-tubulin suppressor-like RCC1 family protein
MLSLSKRKAPFRKRKSVSPEETQEYIEQENILGYPADTSNIQVSCARTYCAAVTASNTVVIWGDADYSSNGIRKIPKNATDIQQIATGDDWIVALKKDGTLVSWGRKGFEDTRPPVLSNVVKIVACRTNFLALLSDGTIRGWGNSEIFDISDIPDSVFENSIEDISIGTNHAVALTSKGKVIIWGDEGNVKFPEIESKIVSIKTFGNFNLALQDNGKLLGWGNKEFGQQIFPSELNEEIVISYSVGAAHCAVITESKKFYTWGWNISESKQYTEIIEDTSTGRIREKRVNVDPEEKKYFIETPEDAFNVKDEFPVKVFCGYDVTFVVMDSGDVIGWGDKKYDLLDVPEVIPVLERLNQPNINLRPFGINLNIDDVIHNKYTPIMSVVKSLKDSGDFFITENGRYKKGKKIGEGSYGKVYIAEKDGIQMAVKVFNLFEKNDYSKSFESNILEKNIQEVVVQVIIQEETKRLNPGFRMCGDIYEVAIDPIKKQFYIFLEKLDVNFSEYIEDNKPSAAVFANLMIQMAEKLNWLYDNLEFNHRDFSDANAMVKFMDSKRDSVPEFLIIDFGFSCLSYRNVRIKVKEFFEEEKCFQETRDITFFVYNVFRHASRERSLPIEVLKVLQKMLIFKVKGKTCNLAREYCPFEKSKKPEKWRDDLYGILNQDYVYNPNATTDKLIEYMTPFLEESY